MISKENTDEHNVGLELDTMPLSIQVLKCRADRGYNAAFPALDVSIESRADASSRMKMEILADLGILGNSNLVPIVQSYE